LAQRLGEAGKAFDTPGKVIETTLQLVNSHAAAPASLAPDVLADRNRPLVARPQMNGLVPPTRKNVRYSKQSVNLRKRSALAGSLKSP
jgi:hypothetical protein